MNRSLAQSWKENPSPGAETGRVDAVDPWSAMTPRFGWLTRRFGHRFFAGFELESDVRATIRKAEQCGAVVYVMRYSSRLDYLLFNWLFLASGIRLSCFANGLRFYYYRPIGEALRLLLRAGVNRLRLRRSGIREHQIQGVRRAIHDGASLFLFLRTAKIGQEIGTRRHKIESGRSELDYLREIVDTCFVERIQVSLVPLALFWRKGLRPDRPFLNLFYGAPARPSDTGKLLSFLRNYRNLAIRAGTPIDLRAFVDERREAGRESLVKQVRRSLMIFLRREEKPILGAALRLLDKIEELVLADRDVQQRIERLAQSGPSRMEVEKRARRLLREIAARQNGTALAILDAVVGWMFDRLFARVEVYGLERVVEAAKMYPLVLIPGHRSHFDYLILSWLFYEKHLVPPHVAAGVNLGFWPLGPILRRAGGFFLRRTFEGDPLYSAVFRAYVRLLIKDGATQEFFIEGTRSRTGKTLPPRLGMLSMIVDAFSRGARRDLFLVPIGFTYERLVEVGSMTQERRGVKKRRESLWSLVSARRIFRNRFGSVVIRFGDPISLAGILGSDPLPVGAPDPVRLAWLHRQTVRLGNELCHRINTLCTAGRSAVSSTALLASCGEALRMADFRARVRETVGLLERMGMHRTEPLEQVVAQDRLEAVLDLLLQAKLVERTVGPMGELIRFDRDSRDRLDLYRATLLPLLAWPAVLALGGGCARSREQFFEDAEQWLSLLRFELFPSEESSLRRAMLGKGFDYLVERDWLREEASGGFDSTSEGQIWLTFLANQLLPILEAYAAFFRALEQLEGRGERQQLLGRAERIHEQQLLLGEARYPEGKSSVAFANALLLLRQEEIVTCDGNPNRATTRYSPGPDWDRLGPLVELVASAVETR